MIDKGSNADAFVTLPNGKRVPAVAVFYQNGLKVSGIARIPIDQYMQKLLGATTLDISGVIDEYTITITNATNFNIGNSVYLTHPENFYFGTVLNKVDSVITLDTPLTYSFPTSGTIASSFTKELNVNGSITPQTFSILGPGSEYVTLNVTGMVMECLTEGPVDLSKFADIATGLTKGCVLRGNPTIASGLPATINWNVKTNGDLSLLGQLTPYLATNPAQGQDGFVWKYSFGKNEEHAAIPFLNEGDRIDFVVQDDLRDITKLRILYSGNIEQPLNNN